MKKDLTYEEKLQEVKERSIKITQMLSELKAGRDVDFNLLTSLIADGHSNERSLIHEIEEVEIQNRHRRDIQTIDIPSFMNK
jgi:hypothetical protein